MVCGNSSRYFWGVRNDFQTKKSKGEGTGYEEKLDCRNDGSGILD